MRKLRYIQRVMAGAMALAFVAVAGCAHVDEMRADRHEDRAERAAEHGHFVKAAKEEHKANREERQAEHEPLP